MDRKSIENWLKQSSRSFVHRVELAPVPAVAIAFVIGIIAGQFLKVLIIVAILVAFGTLALLIFAPEKQGEVDDREADDDGPLNRP